MNTVLCNFFVNHTTYLLHLYTSTILSKGWLMSSHIHSFEVKLNHVEICWPLLTNNCQKGTFWTLLTFKKLLLTPLQNFDNNQRENRAQWQAKYNKVLLQHCKFSRWHSKETPFFALVGQQWGVFYKFNVLYLGYNYDEEVFCNIVL